MLRTFACFDVFAELLNRKQLRSAAAIFIDATNAVAPQLGALHDVGDSESRATTADELDDRQEELSSMWTYAAFKIDTETRSRNTDVQPEWECFHDLMEFTARNIASRSPRHRQFYEQITGAEITEESPLSLNTVAWFLNT